jgi:predicted transcriptional regulator
LKKIKQYHDYVGLTTFVRRQELDKKRAEKRVVLKKLRGSRKRAKLSIPALAEKARVSRHATYWADHGEAVSRDIATRLASALGVKLASLRS